jgi:hypothetical protein
MFLSSTSPKDALKAAVSGATTAIDDYNSRIGG